MEKQSYELPSAERVNELKGLGFTTALVTAGVPEAQIGELYTKYQEQDAARTQNLEAAYNTIIGK